MLQLGKGFRMQKLEHQGCEPSVHYYTSSDYFNSNSQHTQLRDATRSDHMTAVWRKLMYVKGKVIESCLRLFGTEVSPHLLGKTSSKFEKVVNLRDLNYPTVSCQPVLKIKD